MTDSLGSLRHVSMIFVFEIYILTMNYGDWVLGGVEVACVIDPDLMALSYSLEPVNVH